MKFFQTLMAILGVAVALNPAKEATETWANRCVYGYQRINTRSHCNSWALLNTCCIGNGGKNGLKRYYYRNIRECNQMGGHFCKMKQRYCSGWQGYRYAKHLICKKSNVKWHRAAGAAYNIAHNGKKIWVIGTNVEGGGYGIYRWDGHWTKIPGSAIRAAVDANGRGWVVNKFAYIYGYNGARWIMIGGRAWDIDVGTGNKLWVIGTNVEGGGYGIYRWDGRWTKVPGSAVRIAVDGQGYAWVVNKYRAIYRYWVNRWYRLPGAAFDIAAFDNNVAVVGTDRRPWRYYHLGNTWDVMTGGALYSLAMGGGSRIACTTTYKGIFAAQ